eukprot:1284575-Amorphochlora_amoeboformis.AAC.2
MEARGGTHYPPAHAGANGGNRHGYRTNVDLQGATSIGAGCYRLDEDPMEASGGSSSLTVRDVQ